MADVSSTDVVITASRWFSLAPFGFGELHDVYCGIDTASADDDRIVALIIDDKTTVFTPRSQLTEVDQLRIDVTTFYTFPSESSQPSPPSFITLTVPPTATVSGVVTALIAFYRQNYHISIETDEIRLIHNGRELERTSNARVLSVLKRVPLRVVFVFEQLSRFILDASSCPPHLMIDATLLRCSMSTDSKWSTVRATAAYTRGRHFWRTRFDSCQSGNAFIGVVTADAKLTNYLGADSHGYGYYGCGNTYRQGSSRTYGTSFRTNDVITTYIDCDRRELHYAKGAGGSGAEEKLGIAFTELPALCFPAFSLYSKDDAFTIIEFGSW